MGGIRADPMAESDLRFVFYSTRIQRYLNRVGYVRLLGTHHDVKLDSETLV